MTFVRGGVEAWTWNYEAVKGLDKRVDNTWFLLDAGTSKIL